MALDFTKYKALTFDCYGTLIDWETGLLSTLMPFLEFQGHTPNPEDVLALYGKLEAHEEHGLFKTYKEVLRQCMHGIARHYAFPLIGDEEDMLVHSIQHWQPFPDTVAALEKLKTRYKLCIVSNIDADLIAYSQRWLHVPFDEVVTAEEVGIYKPAHSHFIEAQKRLGLPMEQILHVAQSLYHDIAPARELGLANVWVNRRRGKEGSGATPVSDAMPDMEVGSLGELVELMGLG
jgi:2-haloacid dehalogenase